MIEVMIIRPEKEVGMGCCGGICSDPDGLVDMKDEFKHHDDDREKLRKMYQQTHEKYGELVQIGYLDPRNLLAMIVYFAKHVKKGDISILRAVHSTLFHIKYNAIFINGQFVEQQDYEAKVESVLDC